MEKEFVKDLDNIFILGRGQSLVRCPIKKPDKSEYWGCNSIYRARELDRLFIIRDPYIAQFDRDKDLIKNIDEKDFPVYTLGKYEEIKNNILYPVKEVIQEFKTAFLLNTASYMLALAIMQRPKNLMLFGVDMFFDTGTEYMRNEKGCLEFWLGVAIGKRIKFKIAKESTLLKRRGRNAFYGMTVKVDKDKPGLQLEPKYLGGKEKCAFSYKIVKISHNI